jgi:antitoxin HigA-1
MATEKLLNVHPGEILKTEFLDPMDISAYRLSKETGIPESNLSEILNGKRSITANISIKLGKFFELNSNFWLGLQNDYDLRSENYKLESQIKNMNTYKMFIKDELTKNKNQSVA